VIPLINFISRQSLIHPLLFSIFPLISLYFSNIHLVLPEGIFLPIFLVVSFSFVFWFFLKFVLKNSKKAALIVTLFMILFLSYGHILNLFSNFELTSNDITNQIYFLIFFIIIFISGTYFFVKTKRKLDNATKIANIISISLIAVVITNIGIYFIENSFAIEENIEIKNDPLKYSSLNPPPNIYYIVLDEYGSYDTLKKYYDFDNQKFMEFLTKKGFYIPSNSHSNYAETFLSLSSTLNLKYVNYLADKLGEDSLSQQIPYEMINNNLVMNNFKKIGYKIISFDSSWWGTRTLDVADENLCSSGKEIDFHILYLLKETSILKLTDVFLQKDTTSVFHEAKRQKILCQFSEMLKIENKINKPVFVFNYIVAPHDPYVFGPNGEPVNELYTFGPDRGLGYDANSELFVHASKKGYVNQLQFLNLKLEEFINHKLSNTNNPPIIIIQSDTGPFISGNISSEEKIIHRLKNFYAFYLPGETSKILYENITPVNSFRLIFNTYFGTTYELLEDRSYYSEYESPYKLFEINN